MIDIYTYWAADEFCNQKTLSLLIAFQLLSCSTCLCNSRNEVTPLKYYKVSVSGYLQGLTPFHIKSLCLFSSLCLFQLVQASSFSLLPCRLSISDLSIHQYWRSGVLLFPFPGLFIGKRILFPPTVHALLLVLLLSAVSYSTSVPLLWADVVALLCIITTIWGPRWNRSPAEMGTSGDPSERHLCPESTGVCTD